MIKRLVATLAIAALVIGSASAVVRRPDSEKDGKTISRSVQKAIEEGDEAMEAKDYPTAIAAYSKAIDAGELPDEILGAILTNRGLAYYSTKQCPDAISDLTKALEIIPEPTAQIYAIRGQCHVLTGKAAESVADFKQAVTLDPKEASYAGAYCSNAFNAKIYAEAGPACEAYSAFVPADKQIVEASAVSYQNAGNKAKALEMWKKLLALDPNSAVAKQGVKQNS